MVKHVHVCVCVCVHVCVCVCAYCMIEGKNARKWDREIREPIVFVLNAQYSPSKNLGQKTSIPKAGPGD